MSRFRKLWAPMVLAITLALLGVTFSAPAQADSSTPGDGYTAPTPTPNDASGADQDQYYIPADFDHPQYGAGGYYVNGNSRSEGWYSTKGASSVTITTSYNSGTWTFDYSSAVTAKPEAQNTYAVVVGTECKRNGAQYREVTAYMKNVADDTGRYIYSVFPEVVPDNNGLSVSSTMPVQDIRDGQQVAMPLLATDHIRGLRPGRYTVNFWRNDSRSAAELEYNGSYKVKTIRIVVPSCTPVRAKGHLRKLSSTRVKVIANTRGFSETPVVVYRLAKYSPHKRAHVRVFRVKTDKVRTLMAYKPARVIKTFILRVQLPGGGWRVLDRARVPRSR